MGTYYAKMAASGLVILLYIAFTVSCALGGQMIRYIDSKNSEGTPCITANTPCTDEMTPEQLLECDPGEIYPDCSILLANKFALIGSLVNLTLIGINGQVFLAIAAALTQWENHRTDSDVDNALVAKNFIFQFVNNYFVRLQPTQTATHRLLPIPSPHVFAPPAVPVSQLYSTGMHASQRGTGLAAGALLHRIHARVLGSGIWQVTPMR